MQPTNLFYYLCIENFLDDFCVCSELIVNIISFWLFCSCNIYTECNKYKNTKHWLRNRKPIDHAVRDISLYIIEFIFRLRNPTYIYQQIHFFNTRFNTCSLFIIVIFYYFLDYFFNWPQRSANNKLVAYATTSNTDVSHFLLL